MAASPSAPDNGPRQRRTWTASLGARQGRASGPSSSRSRTLGRRKPMEPRMYADSTRGDAIASVYAVYAVSSPGPDHPYTRPRRTCRLRLTFLYACMHAYIHRGPLLPSHTLGRDKRDDQCWRSPSRTFSWSAYDESPARCWQRSVRLGSPGCIPNPVGSGAPLRSAPPSAPPSARPA